MTWLLPRLIGPGATMDLLLTNKRIDAVEAHRIGLVDYLCDPEDLVERAKDYLVHIAANAAPLAIADTKRLLYRHMGAPYPEAFREADTVQWEAIKRPDANEGALALFEKRRASYRRVGDS
jgi:enoyl-CoA hydratase/carnithine racemase